MSGVGGHGVRGRGGAGLMQGAPRRRGRGLMPVGVWDPPRERPTPWPVGGTARASRPRAGRGRRRSPPRAAAGGGACRGGAVASWRPRGTWARRARARADRRGERNGPAQRHTRPWSALTGVARRDSGPAPGPASPKRRRHPVTGSPVRPRRPASDHVICVCQFALRVRHVIYDSPVRSTRGTST